MSSTRQGMPREKSSLRMSLYSELSLAADRAGFFNMSGLGAGERKERCGRGVKTFGFLY